MASRRPLPTLADAALAAGVALVQVGGTALAARHQPERYGIDALGAALLLAGPVALLARRRYPVAVLAVTFATTLAYTVIGYARGPIFFGLIVAFATVLMAGRRAVAWATLAAGFVAFLWLAPLLDREPAPSLAQVVGLGAWLLVLGTTTEIVRSRRQQRAEELRTRQEETRRRASEERLRIARELHDVVAHNIALINVQAGVALHLIDERPEQARTALAAIKDASKEALDELRSVVGILRADGDDAAAPRAPAPGLADLDALVARARAAGLDVRTAVAGEPRPVPPGVDRAAYRIVQEALTNVTRHAGGAAVMVRVAYGDDDITVQIDDDGTGRGASRPAEAGTGSGITGMRERAAALGGRLDAGPRPGGGFRVRAWFPVPSGAGAPQP